MARTLPSLTGTCRTLICSTLLGLATAGPESRAQGFDPVAVYPAVAGTRPFGLALGDVNGDGLLDIVAGDNNGSLHLTSVLLGQPGGFLGAATAYPAASGSWDLALGDVNRDGRLDIVTGCNGPFAAAVQLGQAGGFGPMTTYQTGGGIIQNLALGDVNGDGFADIVLVNLGTNSVNVLLGQPVGGFAPFNRYYLGPDTSPFSVALGDLNGDGQLDIVTGNAMAATVGVLLGQPGGFAPAVAYSAFRGKTVGTPYTLMGVALADVDGDGRLDVVTTTNDLASGPTLGVLLGQAAGLAPIKYFDAGVHSAHGIAVGDVNGDAWPDIVLAGFRAHAAGVLLGYPGGFSTPFSYSTGSNGAPWAVALGDVNRDGRLDIVTTNSASSSVGVLLNAAPLLLTATSITPSSAAVGSTITLNGSNLRGAVAVVFDGTGDRTASSGFAVNAAGTEITGIVVPSGARSGRLRVVTPSGTVTSSTPFTVQTPTGTRAGSAALALRLYPNPAQTKATVLLPAAAVARPVLVLDAVGRTVRRQTLPAQAGSLIISLTGLPAGLYTVRCETATARLLVE